MAFAADLSCGQPVEIIELARQAVVSPAGKQGQGENFNLVIRDVPHKSSVTVFLHRRGRKTAGGAVTGAAERQKRQKRGVKKERQGKEETAKREESSRETRPPVNVVGIGMLYSFVEMYVFLSNLIAFSRATDVCVKLSFPSTRCLAVRLNIFREKLS